MAFCELRYRSESLGMHTAAHVFMPQQPGPFATLYLLHGLGGDHSIWQRFTRLESYLEELDLPLLVVSPNGGRGFYADAQQGFAYESFIVKDLIPFIDNTFQTRVERKSRAISGMSMGGCGALLLALRHPHLFVSAVSHAGGVSWAREHGENPYVERQKQVNEWQRIVGDEAHDGPHDLWALAQKLKPEKRPALRIDCGTEDFLLEINRAFSSHLRQIGYEHEYEEPPGAHNTEYMDARIREACLFHARHLFA